MVTNLLRKASLVRVATGVQDRSITNSREEMVMFEGTTTYLRNHRSAIKKMYCTQAVSSQKFSAQNWWFIWRKDENTNDI